MSGAEDETTVDEGHSVTVPDSVRRELGIEAGDRLRWRVEDDGRVTVEVVGQRYGAFDDLDPVDVGEETDAAGDHDAVAGDS